MDKLNDKLLSAYMDGFYGYGNIKSNFWFIGMEEGGGTSFSEIEQRINVWVKRGMCVVEDLYEYHIDIEVPEWFKAKAPVQNTWNKLIRIFMSANGQVVKLHQKMSQKQLLFALVIDPSRAAQWFDNIIHSHLSMGQ